MSYACMTTFGPEYYEKYGREAVATMAENWPGKVIAYGEGEKPKDLPDRVEYRDLFGQPEFNAFLDWCGKVPLLRGQVPNNGYNYQFNAFKFARKVFAITDMREPFFFVGADVHVVKPIPDAFLGGMLKEKFGAFLFRKAMHTESDFAGYNTYHPAWEQFRLNYRMLYTTGGFLALPAVAPGTLGFHDCWTLDYLIKALNLWPQCTDITNGARGDDANGFHVWPKTALAEYTVHLKGRIKKDPAKKAEALKGAA